MMEYDDEIDVDELITMRYSSGGTTTPPTSPSSASTTLSGEGIMTLAPAASDLEDHLEYESIHRMNTRMTKWSPQQQGHHHHLLSDQFGNTDESSALESSFTSFAVDHEEEDDLSDEPIDHSEQDGRSSIRVSVASLWKTLRSQLPFSNYKPPETLDNWSAAFILINFISVGYILNPSAFAQGGILLGSFCLAFVSLSSFITGIYVLEACTRAEMLKVSTAFSSLVSHDSNNRRGNWIGYGSRSSRYLPRGSTSQRIRRSSIPRASQSSNNDAVSYSFAVDDDDNTTTREESIVDEKEVSLHTNNTTQGEATSQDGDTPLQKKDSPTSSSIRRSSSMAESSPAVVPNNQTNNRSSLLTSQSCHFLPRSSQRSNNNPLQKASRRVSWASTVNTVTPTNSDHHHQQEQEQEQQNNKADSVVASSSVSPPVSSHSSRRQSFTPLTTVINEKSPLSLPPPGPTSPPSSPVAAIGAPDPSRRMMGGNNNGGLLADNSGNRRRNNSLSMSRSSHRRYLPASHSLRVHQRTYELSELCRIFLGRGARNLFTITTLGDLYGITWAFAAVFGSSLSEHAPMGISDDWNYMAYIFVFMAVTVPASCSSITMQVPFQLLFLVGRTIMLLLMLGTLIAAYTADEPHFGTQRSPARETPLADWSAIVTVMQTAVFSTAYQFSVPGLTGETGDKRSMVKIISRSVGYIYATNLILSLLMAIYFGHATEASSNLNWITYHGGTWTGEQEEDGINIIDMTTRSWWATGISSYIVLFAALDGLAVYPLIAMSLGDIMMSALYEDQVHEVQEIWRIRTAFRLVASIPQACGALFLKDLGVIAKYAGVFTVMSYTICPSFLAIRSRQYVHRAGLSTNTRYKTIFSSDYVAYFLIAVAIALIIGVFVDAMIGLSDVLVAENDHDDDTAAVLNTADYSATSTTYYQEEPGQGGITEAVTAAP